MQAEYGIRLLPGGRTEPDRTPSEVADLVVHLPPGCAFGREVGGALALSDEAHLLREAIFRIEVADWHAGQSKGPTPKRIDLPKPAAEIKAEITEQQSREQAKAEGHRRRQAARGT